MKGEPIHLAMVNLTGGGLSGGYQKYLKQLLPLLKNDKRIGRLDVYSPPGIIIEKSGVQAVNWPNQGYLAAAKWIQEHLRITPPDAVFIPTAAGVRFCGGPVVSMVRNMEALTTPFGKNTLKEGIRNLARRTAAWISCKRADRLIAVSQFVRRYLVEQWHIAPEKVAVVYHGVESSSEVSLEKPVRVQKKERFLFAAGSIRPYRALEDVILALGRLRDQKINCDLCIGGHAGPDGQPYQQRLKALISKLDLSSRIEWLGALNPREMAWCYRHCAAFVMTSRVEACPNTALEAMALGCLIVSSTQDPMPEFFGNAALYYEPGSDERLAEQLRRVLTLDETSRNVFSQKALATASGFTWKNTADQTVGEIMIALERCKPLQY
jgi:glycosyltransferase involved in cell wall biosynthesis